MLVDVTLNRSIIDLYFKAWQDYNTVLLREVFSVDAKYVIENKNRCFKGIEEICKYWHRNKKRQANLALEWKTESVSRIWFRACFYDREEHEFQEISGIMSFCFNKQGKICELREYYNKVAQPIEKNLRYIGIE